MDNTPCLERKVKFMEKKTTNNNHIKHFFNEFHKIKIKNKEKIENDKFIKWINSYTYDNEFKVKDIIEKMYINVSNLLISNGFTIIDTNELKNDIANFIYNRS